MIAELLLKPADQYWSLAEYSLTVCSAVLRSPHLLVLEQTDSSKD